MSDEAWNEAIDKEIYFLREIFLPWNAVMPSIVSVNALTAWLRRANDELKMEHIHLEIGGDYILDVNYILRRSQGLATPLNSMQNQSPSLPDMLSQNNTGFLPDEDHSPGIHDINSHADIRIFRKLESVAYLKSTISALKLQQNFCNDVNKIISTLISEIPSTHKNKVRKTLTIASAHVQIHSTATPGGSDNGDLAAWQAKVQSMSRDELNIPQERWDNLPVPKRDIVIAERRKRKLGPAKGKRSAARGPRGLTKTVRALQAQIASLQAAQGGGDNNPNDDGNNDNNGNNGGNGRPGYAAQGYRSTGSN